MTNTKPTTTKKTTKKTAAPSTTEPAKDQKSFLSPNESVKITLAWTQVEPAYQKAVREFGKKVKAEGFRVGKAPAAIVEAQVGFEKIADRVLQELLPAAYTEAIKQAKKSPITHPEFNPISLDKGKDWQLEALFSAAPVVKLKDYKKTIVAAHKTAAKFIKAQNDKIAKEAKECKTDDKGHDHAHAHQPLDESQEREVKLQHIFKALADESAPTIGEMLLRQETQDEFKRLQTQLEQYQIKLDDYLKRRQITIEQLSQELAGNTLSRLQIDFILASISQAEKLAVSDEEVQAELAKITHLETREQMSKNPSYLNQIKAHLLQKKTLDFLLESK